MAAKQKKIDGSVEETTALSASEEDDSDRKSSIKWEGDLNVEGKTTTINPRAVSNERSFCVFVSHSTAQLVIVV